MSEITDERLAELIEVYKNNSFNMKSADVATALTELQERRASSPAAGRDAVIEALKSAAEQFEFYSAEHLEKAKGARFNGFKAQEDAAIEKAKTNARFAERCRVALKETPIKSEDTSPQMTAASSTASTGRPSVAHTPGTWTPISKMDSRAGFPIESGDGRYLASVALLGVIYSGYGKAQDKRSRSIAGQPEGWANACLIAAAPDLLEALKEARQELVEGLELDLEFCCPHDRNGERIEAEMGEDCRPGIEASRALLSRIDAAILKAEGTSPTDGAELAMSQGQAVQNLPDPASPSPKEER